jgi:hypothetical protein
VFTLLVVEALAVTIPFFVLQSVFEFPAILRQPASYALKLFAQHEAVIVPTYYLFLWSALMALPLTLVLTRFFAHHEQAAQGNAALLGFGAATAIFQAIGFSRWVFTVPMLAHAYFAPPASGTTAIMTDTNKQAIALLYDTLNRYAGMTIGEHLGFIAMGAWTCVLAWQLGAAGVASTRTSRIVAWTGYVTGLLTVVSVGEHFQVGVDGGMNAGGSTAQVFAVLNIIANTLWTLWLLVVATLLLRSKPVPSLSSPQTTA